MEKVETILQSLFFSKLKSWKKLFLKSQKVAVSVSLCQYIFNEIIFLARVLVSRKKNDETFFQEKETKIKKVEFIFYNNIFAVALSKAV